MGDQSSQSDSPDPGRVDKPSGVLTPSSRPVFVPPRPTPGRRATPLPPPSPSTRASGVDFRPSLAEASGVPSEGSTLRVASLEAELSGAEGLLRRAQAEVTALRRTVEEQRTRITELEEAERQLRAQHERELEEQAQRFSQLEHELELVKEHAGDAEALVRGPDPSDRGDDLTLIRGIGPAFARALNEQGVTRISQIAGWKDEDLEDVAARMRIRPERIRRAGWVESAQELLRATPA